MIDFCTIDFETATHERSSACEMGICVVQNGRILKTKTWLIKPPSYPYFNPHNVNVHGIYPKDVAEAPLFSDIWHEAFELLYGNLIIAHNAGFDMSVLRGCLDYYGFFKPKMKYLCSIQIAKKSWKGLAGYGLKNLANIHQIDFLHHRAGDDAEACAKISLLGFHHLMITRNDEVHAQLQKSIKDL